MGPQQSRLRTIMLASRMPARELSIRFRSSPPLSGRARKRTGAVPGRRPTNSPPFSEGSLSIVPYVRSYALEVPLAGVQRVEQLRESFVDHVALDLQRRCQLAGGLGQVVIEDHELLDLLNLGVFRVHVVDLVLDERVDGRVAR